jgi:hypothetical protein
MGLGPTAANYAPSRLVLYLSRGKGSPPGQPEHNVVQGQICIS